MRRAAIELFRQVFGTRPRGAASAPGRVNLIGEHTDYNGGAVLPIALAARTCVVAGPAEAGVLEVASSGERSVRRVAWRDGALPRGGSGYVAGVMRELAAIDAAPPGARVAVASDVPIGAGLGSSAALAVSAAAALAALGLRRIDGRRIAGIAYRAEHDHVGVRCGVMDQTVAALAKPGRAVLIECAALETQLLPCAGRLLLVDTGVRHDLADGRYNARRAECEAAVQRLRVELPELVWLASWPIDWLPRLKRVLPEPQRSRALHVVTETARVRLAARLLACGRLKQFGALLYQSHDSCRRLYDCSAPELDLVVRAAKRAGALGAKLTGAGWGGAVVVLIGKREGGRGKGTTGTAGGRREARIVSAIRRSFAKAYGREPAITAVRPSGGMRIERV